ncbi:MAG TPA: ankyrin repeat domain-containing protein [Verrucomicrobiae bacterium]|nr:ankyrin repeat domain-containing protein [Verrucomicrobiae bacterium]
MTRLLFIALLAVFSALADPAGMTPLHLAAHNNDAGAVRKLIKSGADVNATNRYGITPLALACENGNSAIVESLLNAGADANARQRGGETMLMIAARTGSKPSVEALVNRGADVNGKDKKGQTAMMWAAAEGHAPVVDLLIKKGADFKTPVDGGFTPFFFAIREGRAEVVDVLLKAGVDVNEAMQPKRKAGRGPQAGMTPLVLAVENGHFELALNLVKTGADPNDLRPGYAALHAITWTRKPEMGEGEDGLPPPDGSGTVDSLRFVCELVKLGADVNLRMTNNYNNFGGLNKAGATPFLLAAKTADINLLKLFYELGADPNIPSFQGATPLIAAAGLGTLAAGEVAGTEDEVVEVLEWLVKLGADVNAIDKNGETAMHAAAYKNLPKAVDFLASHGAKIEIWNQKNKQGWTPLLIAEGFRPGNFKPSFETIAAIHKAMLAAGVQPPPLTPHEGVNNSDFGPRERKYIPR